MILTMMIFKRLLEEKQNELMYRKLELVSINDAIDSSTQGGRLTYE